jgi:2-oxoglutarate ferredoxin oxidoreductase subunit alpha
MSVLKDQVSIVLAGEAGQGIQAIESILVAILKKSGYHFFATKEYESRVRGGINSTEIRVSSARVSAFSETIDILVTLDPKGIPHLAGRITSETLVVGETSSPGGERVTNVPFTVFAKEAGNVLYSNTVAAGLLCALLGIPAPEVEAAVEKQFARKSDEIRAGNISAAHKGYAAGEDLVKRGVISVSVKSDPAVKSDIVASGAEAVSLGALAGGCNYVCAYPMSPGTSVLSTMAGYSLETGILVEQVEDEIGVANMALGAWYAGSRALVTTSGGGFALMTEAVSLSGMIETPLVVHIAQRPGPATGLPTRTEQADLNLALFAGHGEFPRVILAPGTLSEGFDLARLAFEVADAVQIPVFILTDQYFVDTYYNTPEFNPESHPPLSHVIRTDADYLRYRLTESGISPRGVPGSGEGLVRVDSDEHDEEGNITENLELRVKMQDKRMRKTGEALKYALPPVLVGPSNYRKLVVTWGSSFGTAKEALEIARVPDTALLHFPWVHPLHPSAKAILSRADDIVLAENNSTGQFAELLLRETGVQIRKRVLQYNGMPFSVEGLAKRLSEYFAGGVK